MAATATRRRKKIRAASSARSIPATGKRSGSFNTIAREGEPGGDTWGDLPNMLRVGARNLDHRQLRSRAESDVLGRGAGQAVDAGQPRHETGTALYSSSTLALNPDDGKLAWYFQHVPGETLDMDEVYERVLVDIGDRKRLFTIGKAGILWKLDRKTGEFIGAKETLFQNIFNRSITRPAQLDLPPRHPRAGNRQVDAGLPQHRRRPQLAGHELRSRHRAARSFRSARAAWKCPAAKSSSSTARAAPWATAASTKCPARTATSAGSPPST